MQTAPPPQKKKKKNIIKGYGARIRFPCIRRSRSILGLHRTSLRTTASMPLILFASLPMFSELNISPWLVNFCSLPSLSKSATSFVSGKTCEAMLNATKPHLLNIINCISYEKKSLKSLRLSMIKKKKNWLQYVSNVHALLILGTVYR